ncbi:DMT family transporter [soil metagenome]
MRAGRIHYRRLAVTLSTSQQVPVASRRSAFLLLALAIAIGTVSFTFVKIALRELSALGLATGRVVSSASFFLIVMVFSRKRYRRLDRENRTRVILCGFFGSAGFHILFVWGQQRVSVAVAAVVMATMPMLVAVGEVTFLKHRLTSRHVMGIALCTLGCIAIGMAAGSAGGTSLLGAGAIALAAIVWAGVTVSTRGIAHLYDGWWLNTPGTVLGALVVLALEAPHAGEFASLSLKGWLLVIWLGTASSAFIYFAMTRAMTILSATTAISLGTIVTPSSMFAAWLLLGDAPGLLEFAAAAIVIVGVVLVTT